MKLSDRDAKGERNSVCDVLKRKYGLALIRGRSKIVQELRERIDRVALHDVNILISGESGTGKELAARAIHYLSKRSRKPFIPVNCPAIPDTLWENELFGHSKGAFTDARCQQSGLVKEAEGGTLFLDEICAVSPYVQAKLLRLLEDNEYRPLGDASTRRADIRIIAATNRNLSKLVNEGKFREDLFYRLNVVSIYIPPLRERAEDIPILTDFFMRKYSKEYNRPIKSLPQDTLSRFISYPWPGNIRELENKIQEIIVLCQNDVIDNKLVKLCADKTNGEKPSAEDFNIAKKKVINSFEREYLTKMLTECMGNVVIAARKAGKSRTAFWNLLKKHNLSPKQFRVPM
jgi:DNA-binding NtrC family response regulator